MCGGKAPDGPPAKAAPEPEVQKSATTKPAAAIPKRVPTKKFLETILQNQELTQALESFLQSEFCLENLLFIQKVGVYKDSFKNADLDNVEFRKEQEKIRDGIQKEFMLPSSETEVNIPAKIKREALINLEKLKSQGLKMELEDYTELASNVFEACENHVKTVLVQERIGRFQTTEGFAKVAANVPGI